MPKTHIEKEKIQETLVQLLASVEKGYFTFESMFCTFEQEMDLRSGKPIPPFNRQIIINLVDKTAEVNADARH